MQSDARRSHVCALMAYAVVAIAFSWPLPLHLSTHLTGNPAGDAGVYVWNQWVFQHELIDRRSLPYYTETIFASGPPANLSLHNYTTFQNVLALPLIRMIGVIPAFNIVGLLMSVLTAYATFLLARRVTGRSAEAWIAGLIFAWSPLMITRGLGHYSLIAAAPLPVFFLLLLRADDQRRETGAVSLKVAAALGVTVAWAFSADVYYAVYCLLIGAAYIVGRALTLERTSSRKSHVRWALDILLLSVAGLVAAIVVSGGWSFTLLGADIRIRTLYTPMLVLTALAVMRVGLRYHASVASCTGRDVADLARYALVAGVVAAVLMSPVLYAVSERIIDGRFEMPEIHWRSSPPGTDLLALFAPNPNHPLAPAAVADWLTARPNGYLENVASLPWVAMALLLIAWRTGWRAPRLWTSVMVVFGVLALGPFVQVAGFNTQIPGPWAILRYAPIVGLARSPTRFTVILTLAFAVIVACALTWLGRRYPRHRRRILAGSAALLVFELLPVPRPLFEATVPLIYRQVAAAPADVRILELPFGLRDGASSTGNATAQSQFFQTFHGKPLQGGYLSRVSRRRIEEVRKNRVLDALITLSEDRALEPDQERAIYDQGALYVREAKLGYIVINRSRASERLWSTAVAAFGLRHVESDGPYELYTPAER
jgi:hypothetical protein